MHFEVRKEAPHEWAVYAVSMAAGGDAALIAVFGHPKAAEEFKDIMNDKSQETFFKKFYFCHNPRQSGETK
jgi:hypothetical protein